MSEAVKKTGKVRDNFTVKVLNKNSSHNLIFLSVKCPASVSLSFRCFDLQLSFISLLYSPLFLHLSSPPSIIALSRTHNLNRLARLLLQILSLSLTTQYRVPILIPSLSVATPLFISHLTLPPLLLTLLFLFSSPLLPTFPPQTLPCN